MKKIIISLIALCSISAFADTTVGHESANRSSFRFQMEIDQNAPQRIQRLVGAGSPFSIVSSFDYNLSGSNLVCDLQSNGEFNGGQIFEAGNSTRYKLKGKTACVLAKNCMQKNLPSLDSVYSHVFNSNSIEIEYDFNTREVLHITLPEACSLKL